MNYKNKLMGLSLILLAAFSACTDDVENGGRDSGTDDHRITFAVGTESPDARTRADGSLPDAAGSYETNSVEMQGKLDGKNVYLTAEVSDGLPGDDQPLTRGTQVTGVAQVDEFSVSAAILDANVFEPETLDVMYYVKSNCDWECTLSDPNGITGSAAPALCKPTLKGSTSGVQSDSFDNENAKLTLETIQPTDTETRKGKVKLTFTFPSKPGKTVEKEVTLTSSLMVEYPTGSDIWYKLSQGSMSCHDLMTTDTPTLPDNADFATAIAKVVGTNVTYSRELVATRMLNPDDNTQCFTYFGIRRATPDGSTIVVNLSRITLENYGGSTFDEKNFMTWGGTYYPVGSTWTVTKDNYDVKTHVDDMGTDLPVWESTAMGNWGYDQAYDYSSSTFRYPGYYTIKNNKFGYYSIEKVSN